jgi:aspartate carbamoyltransferase catalytic subunit
MGILHNDFSIDHVISSKQFSREALDAIFTGTDEVAAAFADRRQHTFSRALEGAVMASLFYEPSTRTRFSFESGMLRLGGRVIGTENAREFSSTVKGESLYDTIRVVNNYADIIVMRHNQQGAADLAASVSRVPIINAGDGKGEHPTQALLDLYTIRRCLGAIDGVHIAMVGDLRNGRTVRSLAQLLCNYRDVHITFVAPDDLQVLGDVKDYLSLRGVPYALTASLEAAFPSVDCVYMTRIQRERMTPEERSASAETDRLYSINADNVERLPERTLVLHPLPRNREIEEISKVDGRKNSVYLDDQVRSGLYVRAFLLKDLLS